MIDLPDHESGQEPERDLSPSDLSEIRRKVRLAATGRSHVILEHGDYINQLVTMNANRFTPTEAELQWGKKVERILEFYLIEAARLASNKTDTSIQHAVDAKLEELTERNSDASG